MKKNLIYSIKYILLAFFLVILPLALIKAAIKKPFDMPQKLGGEWVSAKTLNLGHETYTNYCMQCHGISGDGLGPAAMGAYPPPRNFKEGVFKFANVSSGELPRDVDLAHTIRYGLTGTPMLPWDISDKRLNAVVQYIKTFSDIWKEEVPGEALDISQNPFTANQANEAIELGRKVYNGVGKCFTCHAAYDSKAVMNQHSIEMTESGIDDDDYRENLHVSLPLASEYGVEFVPPDFTKHHIKSGNRLEDIYRVLNAGVNGAGMASWKGMLSASGDEAESERNQWALAHYIKSLNDLKYDWEKKKAFKNSK